MFSIVVSSLLVFFFVKQMTAYEMRISDWSSDVCSSDLLVRAQRDRLAVADEGELTDLHLAAALFRLRLGQPHRRHLRPRIGAARYVALVHRMNALVARDRLRRDDALMARLVRQPRRSGDVADRPDALDI